MSIKNENSLIVKRSRVYKGVLFYINYKINIKFVKRLKLYCIMYLSRR